MNNFYSALNYNPRPDDLFVATYPKCGTTWTQHIIMLILNHGQPVKSPIKFFASTPFLEMTGAEGAENMLRPGVIKVHFPFPLVPWSDEAKYIYVTRNPKDCCVSFYYHQKNVLESFNGDFDQFFELFFDGKTAFGDYFEHLLGWYAHRHDRNVLFLTYEEIKEQPETNILKMASFIDDKLYAESLRNDSTKLQNIVKFSSFEYMKQNVDKLLDDVLAMSSEQISNSELSSSMKNMFLKIQELQLTGDATKTSSEFMRKGIIGDWKNYFSDEQSERMDRKFLKMTKDTDIPNLWQKYM